MKLDQATETINMLYGNPNEVISDCLRSFLVAKPNYSFIAVDFSKIEGRVLAWLADEAWKVQAFFDFDKGVGEDLYILSAAIIFGIPVNEVTKEQRQIGKVAELALGYQGGVGAFQTMAKGYGVKVSDTKAESIKNIWRTKNPRIKTFWYKLEKAAKSAILSKGKIFEVKTKNAVVQYLVKGSFLWCKLPSERTICYPYPKIKEIETPWGEMKDAVTYMGKDATTKKWGQQNGYGGLFAENITQAVARDVLAESMLNLEKSNYKIVMHVHDENVVEVNGNGSLKEVELIMSQTPAWAKSLPIAVEGWQDKVYRK